MCKLSSSSHQTYAFLWTQNIGKCFNLNQFRFYFGPIQKLSKRRYDLQSDFDCGYHADFGRCSCQPGNMHKNNEKQAVPGFLRRTNWGMQRRNWSGRPFRFRLPSRVRHEMWKNHEKVSESSAPNGKCK